MADREQPVPQRDMPGEQSRPTQPFPAKRRHFARPTSLWSNEVMFTPATSTRKQISVPGELGGSNWGGRAADPQTGMLCAPSTVPPFTNWLRTHRSARSL
jgi:quinoprotein glucose dehydrogenase